MKLLLLTQYFPPEVGAPQNRLFELAVRLQKKGIDVIVLTAMPNYPQMVVYPGYKGKGFMTETMDGLQVHRSRIYVTKKRSVIPRLLNYFSFVFTSFFAGWLKLGKFDVILCESPPLFLGISAYLLAKLKGAKLVFNVSDLWPESAEKLGIITNKLMLGMSTRLEEFLYRKSALVTGQTQGIIKNISTRFPLKKTYWLPNGVDLDFYDSSKTDISWKLTSGFKENDFLLLYAGIIGHAQGLEVILKAAKKVQQHPDIKFAIVGSGPELNKLFKLKVDLQAGNVHFFDTVSKPEMPEVVSACDASVIPLKKIDLFKGAIPSKIFESLAMKKPVLLGVEGEARQLFIDEGKCGLAFIPEDENSLAESIMKLYNDRNLLRQLGENGREYVKQKFSRDKIAADFSKILLSEI